LESGTVVLTLESGTVVLALGLLFEGMGAALLLIYGPAPDELRVTARAARMARLGLVLVFLGFVVPFAGTVVQAFER
jgi:hypothetical protein